MKLLVKLLRIPKVGLETEFGIYSAEKMTKTKSILEKMLHLIVPGWHEGYLARGIFLWLLEAAVKDIFGF